MWRSSVFIVLLVMASSTSLSSSSSPHEVNKKKRKEVTIPDRYDASCAVHLVGGDTAGTSSSLPCKMALYSAWHTFRIKEANLVVLDSNLCSSMGGSGSGSGDGRRYESSVAVVSRGECAFDVKTQHASEAGFAALLIVNVDEDVFPFGDGHSRQADGIPTAMVGNSFWDFSGVSQCKLGECPEISFSFSYVSIEKPRRPVVNVDEITPFAAVIPSIGYLCVSGALLGLLLSSLWSLSSSTKRPDDNIDTASAHDRFTISTSTRVKWWAAWKNWGLFHVSLFVVVTISFLCGCVTLRKRVLSDGDRYMLSDASLVVPYGNKEITYNHKETDELIFETLTATISKRFWDYSLQSSGIIHTFQLSKENYDDNIFIHPPFFVYSLHFLHSFLGIPLVFASIVFSTFAAFLVSPLALALCNPLGASCIPSSVSPWVSKSRVHEYALWAVVIYTLCPIGRSCSQKIWIDNAAAFTAVVAALFHVKVIRDANNFTPRSLYVRNAASGLVYGFVTLNCKITSLAMLPFLLSWTVLIAVTSHPKVTAGSFLSVQHCFRVAICCCNFVLGAGLGHGPWVLLYYRVTGRILPNAWPSKKMIENSLYLQAAISRHPAAYLIDMLKFSPLQLLGLLFGLCTLCIALFHTASAFFKKWKGEAIYEAVCSPQSIRRLAIASFSLWPLGFVGGLTLVGSFGGGFQNRFIVPILPATSVLSGMAVVRADSYLLPLVALLLAYCAMHCLYYSVLYSPLFADMRFSVFDLIRIILETPYDPPLNAEISFLKHFGLKLD